MVNSFHTVVSNRMVSVKMTILRNATPIYSEVHHTQTNATGLFTLIIGSGIVEFGDFSSIPWHKGNYSLKREYDPEGGNNYVIEGENAFYPVPFANFALRAASNPLIDVNGTHIPTISVDTLEWMAANLSVTHYNDGTPIPTTDVFVYNNDSSYLPNYGRLYSWTAVNTDKLCPIGWHVPSKEEWEALFQHYPDGKVLKVATTAWNGFANNQSKFSARPGGFTDGNSMYSSLDILGYYWTATSQGTAAWSVGFFPGTENAVLEDTYYQNYGMSVRCVK
jgi:uncharacterized protein (TIGR02145 family)